MRFVKSFQGALSENYVPQPETTYHSQIALWEEGTPSPSVPSPSVHRPIFVCLPSEERLPPGALAIARIGLIHIAAICEGTARI